MEASPVVLEWLAQAQAFTSGREEGRAEGLAEARAESCAVFREILLLTVQKRFQVDPPADLVAVVQNQTELAVFRRWLKLSIYASSLEEFRVALELS
ncbi:MAG TPA: hypothetical protein VMG10_20200 [Gemmataceae bacterium]|nr:hypothetical protein [Gemmataceae bacterium]